MEELCPQLNIEMNSLTRLYGTEEAITASLN